MIRIIIYKSFVSKTDKIMIDSLADYDCLTDYDKMVAHCICQEALGFLSPTCYWYVVGGAIE